MNIIRTIRDNSKSDSGDQLTAWILILGVMAMAAVFVFVFFDALNENDDDDHIGNKTRYPVIEEEISDTTNPVPTTDLTPTTPVTPQRSGYNENYVTIPEAEGIRYMSNGKVLNAGERVDIPEGSTLYIEAKAIDGYEIISSMNTDWEYSYISPEPTNWQPLIWTGSGILGLIVLAGGGFIVFRVNTVAKRTREENKRKKAEEEAKRREIVALWKTVIERHHAVLREYNEYEIDMWKALSYPALHDVEVKETSNFLKTMRDTRTIEKVLDKNNEIPGSKELYDRYEKAVSVLEADFLTAKNKAHRLGDDNLSTREKKDIKTARSLLNHAENSGNNAELRASYYEQLRRIINRLNENHKTPIIPHPIFEIIEQNSRLLLTDGSENNNDLLSDDNSLLSTINISSSQEYDKPKVI